jgi:hypothetical protein
MTLNTVIFPEHNTMKTLKIFLIIFCCCIIISAQKNKENCLELNQDIRLVQYKPSVYITFEKSTKKTKDSLSEQILLRLHNNTRWQISLSGNSEDKTSGIYDVPYMIRKRSSINQELGSEYIFIGKRKNEVGVIWRIESGKSILFSIDRNHLTEDSFVMVDFSYEWEKLGLSGGDFSIFHQALFGWTDLPKIK